MKVALIGNIAGNLPALEAVLEHAKKHEIEKIWTVGDLLGYNIFPDETVQRLITENTLSVLGNFDIQVLKVKLKQKKLRKTQSPDRWLVLNWLYDNLNEENLRFLRSLKRSLKLKTEQKRIMLVNSVPGKEKPDEPNSEVLLELAVKEKADLLIYTHQSKPSSHKVNDIWLINAGSMGLLTDSCACYSILHFKPGFFQVRHYRVEYDQSKTLSAIRERDLPETFIKMLSEKKKADPSFEETAVAAVKEMVDAQWTNLHANRLTAVRQLARSCLVCKYTLEHSNHVTELALKLFDQLQPLHQLGATERFWLECGAQLHDIGWVVGQQGHHKIAFNIIVNTGMLPFDKRERFIIGSIALYHRKSIPNVRHLHYVTLEPADRRVVSVLASILRVADGLDRTHQKLITNLTCEILTETLTIKCDIQQPAAEERRMALEKGTLLEQVFERKLVIEWNPL